jgi:hypothetical protein
MKALVVYESMFGNTAQVARAVASGLSEHGDVRLVEVATEAGIVEPFDLVVIGGPTHAFSMTRPSTREDAIKQGASQGSTAVGIREWLERLDSPGRPRPEAIATFDTRVNKVRHLPGSAAKGAARLAHKLGLEVAAKPESFYVGDVSGPLLEGELDRAQGWGAQLGSQAADRAGERAK